MAGTRQPGMPSVGWCLVVAHMGARPTSRRGSDVSASRPWRVSLQAWNSRRCGLGGAGQRADEVTRLAQTSWPRLTMLFQDPRVVKALDLSFMRQCASHQAAKADWPWSRKTRPPTHAFRPPSSASRGMCSSPSPHRASGVTTSSSKEGHASARPRRIRAISEGAKRPPRSARLRRRLE